MADEDNELTREEDLEDVVLASDIALVALQGLLASGQYGENAHLAAYTAWQLVPHFYEGARQAAETAAQMNAAFAEHQARQEQQG